MIGSLFRRFGRLGVRLWGPFLLLALVSLVVGTVVLYATYSGQRRYVASLQEEVAIRASLHVSDYLQGIENNLVNGAQALGNVSDDTVAQQRHLRALLDANPAFFELALIDLSGRETGKVARDHTLVDPELLDQSGSDKFLVASQGQTYLGSGSISEFAVPVYTLAVPVYDDANHISGVLAAEVIFGEMRNVVTHLPVGQTGYVYLVDGEGSLIVYHDLELIKRQRDVSQQVVGVQRFLAGDLRVAEYQSLDGRLVIGARQPIAGTDWGLITELPVREAYQTANLFLLASALISLLVLGMALAMGWFITRRVVRPLSALHEGAAILGRGNLDYRIQVDAPDEIEELATEFNAMAASLQQSQAEIQARLREVSSLVEAGRAITSLDLRRVLDILVKEAARAVEARACVVYVLDEDSHMLEPESVWSQPGVECSPSPQSVGDGVVGWIARHTQTLRVEDGHNDPEFTPQEADCAHHNAMGLPLMVSGRLVGVMLVTDKVDADSFTANDERLLEAFADQAAVAVENAELYGEERRRSRELALVNRISRTVTSSLDLEMTLDTILASVRNLLPYVAAEICLWDPEKNVLVSQGWGGDPAYRQLAADTYTPDEGYTGWIAVHQNPLLVPDINTFDEVRPKLDPGQLPVGGYVGVPLMVGDAWVGTLELISNEPNAYRLQDLDTLQTVANHAAVAIQNARLFAAAERNVREFSVLYEATSALSSKLSVNELLNDLAQRMVSALEADQCAISTWDEPGDMLWTVAWGQPEGGTQAAPSTTTDANRPLFSREKPYLVTDFPARAEVLRSQQPVLVLVSDPGADSSEVELLRRSGWSSMLMLPLVLPDSVVGLVEIYDAQERQFTQEEIRLAQALTSQAAVALHNVQLFSLTDERLHKRIQELSGLQRISQELNSTLDQHRILQLVLKEAIRATDADLGNVNLHDSDTGQLLAYASFGLNEEETDRLKGGGFYAGTGVMGRVLQTGEPILVPDVSVDPDYVMISSKSRSEVAVPIVYTGDVAGVINLESRQLDAFSEEQLQYLQALANQAAVAIGNALAYEEQRLQRDLLRQRAQQLARLSEISHAFRTDQPLVSVLEDIAYAINETLGFNVVLMSLAQGDPPALHRVAGAGIPLVDMERLKATPQSKEVVISLMQDRFQLGLQSYYIPHTYKEIWEDRLDTHYTPPEHQAEPGEPCWDVDDLCFSPLYDSEQRLIGVISVDSPRDGRVPTQSVMETLELFANQAAAAIENAQLFEQTRQYADQLRAINVVGVEITSILSVDQLITRVSQLVEDNFGYRADIALIEEDYLAWRVRDDQEDRSGRESSLGETYHLKVGEGISGWVAASGQTAVVPDVKQDPRYIPSPESQESLQENITRSEVAIPLKVQDRIIGVLDVQSDTPEGFDENDVLVLQSLASQAAVAIANAQLFEHVSRLGQELEQRVQERTEALADTLKDLTLERDRVETLYRITRELSASLDLDRVLAEALSLINQAVGVSHGSIMLLDPSTGNLTYRAALGRTRALPRGGKTTRYRRGVGLAGWVLETGEAVIVPDLTKDPYWIPEEQRRTPERKSALAVPLSIGEDVLGVLLLFHPDIDYFTHDHLKLVSAAATQVATAINNAELYQLITDQAERLGVMLRTHRAEASKLQAIVEGIADGVLVLDVERHVMLMNPAAARILGVEASAVEGRHLREILGRSESKANRALSQQLYDRLMTGMDHLGALESLQEDDAPSLNFRLEAEKKVVVVNLSSASLGGSGDLPSLVTVLRDISREAEVDRLKNEFISTVSHELRTPMTSIKGYSDLLVSERVGTLSEQQRRFVRVIKDNADRLTALVNDILDLSRIETGRIKLQIEALDLVKLVNRAAESFQGQMAEKSVKLSSDLPPRLPSVRGDETRVAQILENLISNAWKYTGAGGRVTVRAQVADGFVQVDVADTGIGISSRDLPNIFDRFYRAEQEEVQNVGGSGLGLSIVKMFVGLLGGKIWVQSEVGRGSTFSFTLPLVAGSSEGSYDHDAIGPKILVVDDDEHILQLLRHQLEADGYRVITAQRGEEVLQLARNEQPDLITLDILLVESNGFEVLEELKGDSETCDIPVIIVSVVPDAETRGLALGAAGYIGKPFEENQVLSQVQEVLSSLGVGENGQFNHVLVVDDDRHIVEWLKEALTSNGFVVKGAYNGNEALALAREDSPDLILLDLKMPDMDGYEVIRHLRRDQATRDIPVIVITGISFDDDYDHVKILGMGVEHMLTKPFSIETLVEEIKRVGTDAASQF
jgi:PAS domain S-box-containing protein